MSNGTTVGRRALIASAAALAAGLIAKQTTEPAEAQQPSVLLNTFNTGASITGITSPAAVSFQANSTADSGAGIVGFNSTGATGVGTKGLSNYIGVQGGIGALGQDVAAGFTIGVQGANFATGTSNTGVQGLIDSLRTGAAPNTTPNSIGVEGRNNSTGAGSIGVLGTIGPYPGFSPDTSTATGALNLSVGRQTFGVTGEIHGASGAGLIGASHGTGGVGVQGSSANSHGLVGSTDSTGGHAGLIGNANKAGGVGLMGIAPNYGNALVGRAGDFYGNVKVNGGAFMAPTMQAVAQHAGDNTLRALHTVASPDAWFEDFGKANLVNGSADIKFDAGFAGLVHTDDYHVFLTEIDTHHHLNVTNMSATGFTVTADAELASTKLKRPTQLNGVFSYRVVAKRKDMKSERLAKVPASAAPERPTNFDIPVPEQHKAMRDAILAAAKK